MHQSLYDQVVGIRPGEERSCATPVLTPLEGREPPVKTPLKNSRVFFVLIWWHFQTLKYYQFADSRHRSGGHTNSKTDVDWSKSMSHPFPILILRKLNFISALHST